MALESIEVPSDQSLKSPRAAMKATKRRLFVDKETERVSNIMFGLFSK